MCLTAFINQCKGVWFCLPKELEQKWARWCQKARRISRRINLDSKEERREETENKGEREGGNRVQPGRLQETRSGVGHKE